MKYTKRLVTAILMLMLVLALAVPTFAKSKAKKPKLSQKKVTLETGGKVTLTLKNAKASKVKWSSTNKKVATVKKGKVTAKWKNSKKSKTCYIKAKYKGKTYKCKVTVKKTTQTTKVIKVGYGKTQKVSMSSVLDSSGNFKVSKVYPSVSTFQGSGKPELIQTSYGYCNRVIFSRFKIGSNDYIISQVESTEFEGRPSIYSLNVSGLNRLIWYSTSDYYKDGSNPKSYTGPRMTLNTYEGNVSMDDLRKDFAKNAIISCDKYPVVEGVTAEGQEAVFVRRGKDYVFLYAENMSDREPFTVTVRYRNITFNIPSISYYWKLS